VFEVDARDGAGRIVRWRPEKGPAIEAPAILWLERELGPNEGEWQPQVGPKGSAAFLAANRSIQEPEPDASGGLVLTRRLETPALLLAGAPNLRAVGAINVWPNAINLFRNPKHFAPALARARREAGYATLLYAPGLGEPNDLAILVYAGVDLVDAACLSYAAARGIFLTLDGSQPADKVKDSECACPACQETAVPQMEEEQLRRHNHWAARTELARVRNALRQGRLRELVEARVRSHPEKTALLRRLDAQYAFFEERTPVASDQSVWATAKESLKRPEVARFRERVANRYMAPGTNKILLLLPCSARKPYGTSQSHRRFADALWRSGATGITEEWIVTSPLGVVPRPLERVFPAAHYDVPVTGEWDAEEGDMIRATLEPLLKRHTFDAVVAHLPASTLDLIRPLLPADTHVTCASGGPTKGENLDKLTSTMAKLADGRARIGPSAMLHGRMLAVASYQFAQSAAQSLCQETGARGKWPGGKLLGREGQVASLPLEKGLLSLTMEGGHRLLQDAAAPRVEIDDFDVKGSVFAVAVRQADAAIRVGDDVILTSDGRLKGVGTAAMNGTEMVEMARGVAVKVRHHG
jgi:archaeosine synthase alpha-subunit